MIDHITNPKAAELAYEILDHALDNGIEISINKVGVAFKPPLTSSYLMAAVQLGNTLAHIVETESDKYLSNAELSDR